MAKSNSWSEHNIRKTMLILAGKAEISLDQPLSDNSGNTLEIGDAGAWQDSTINELEFRSACQNLSREAKDVLRIIFALPDEVTQTLTPTKLSRFMKELGWSNYKFQRATWTIRKMLKGLGN